MILTLFFDNKDIINSVNDVIIWMNAIPSFRIEQKAMFDKNDTCPFFSLILFILRSMITFALYYRWYIL